MNFQNEHCYFLYGFRLRKYYIGWCVYHSIGSSANVDFDWEKIYSSNFILGFYHNHPSKGISYSKTDKETMTAWVSCLWRDMICGIWDCMKEERRCYLFCKDKSVREIKDYWLGPLYIAKVK